MTKLFNIRWPIIQAPMNRVSNLELALSVYRAGALPCIVSFCYYKDKKFSVDQFVRDLEHFVSETGSNEFLLALDNSELLYKDIQKAIKKLSIRHFLFYSEMSYGDLTKQDTITLANKIKESLPGNVLSLVYDIELLQDQNCAAYIVKGSNGAGRPGKLSTQEMFLELKRRNTGKPIIPMGGIGTAQEVKWYLDHGAPAVAIGTLFAACTESILSMEAKQALVSTNSNMLQRLDSPTNQKGLILDQTSLTFDHEDNNNTHLLMKGIRSGTTGVIFAGDAVDHINKINTVQEVVDRLTNFLPK